MNIKKSKLYRFVAGIMMAALLIGTLAGCGSSENAKDGGDTASAYETAVDMLNAVWENANHDYPVFGGNFSNPTDNEPGQFDLKDTDTMKNTLLIPDDLKDKITDAATVFHMMNTNTLTAAAIKLDGMSAEDAAGKIKDAFKGNAFICGIPDKIVIATVGPDVVYFYGAADIVDELKAEAEKLEGAVIYADETYA